MSIMRMFSGSLFGYSWKSRLIVLVVNAVGLGVFLSTGYWLDRLFATSPAMLILSLLLSFPVVQLVTARILLSRHHALHKPSSDS